MELQAQEKIFFIYADDDQDDHELLQDAIGISSLNYDVRPVYDGQELISLLDRKNIQSWPSFLVVDLNMPKIDGFTAISLIRSKLQLDKLPIYALSTSRNEADRQKAIELGASGFYTKPAKVTDLRKIVEEMAVQANRP